MANTIDTGRLIRDLLHIHGTSFAQVGREIGVTRTAVSLVACGKSKSARIRMILADAVGLSMHHLWPEDGQESGVVAVDCQHAGRRK